MSEIEKLYKNAGVMWEERYDDCILNKEGNCDFRISCDMCDYSKEKYIYPPFTAEKQIELIKFLGSLKDYTVETDKFKGVYYVGCREAGNNNKHWGSHNLFEEALAELVNDLWQDLTEEEKQQVKGILK